MIDFSLYPLNRHSDKRHDTAFVEHARAQPTTRFVVFADSALVLQGASRDGAASSAAPPEALFTPEQTHAFGAPAGTLYLGHTEQGHARFALSFASNQVPPELPHPDRHTDTPLPLTPVGLRAVALAGWLDPGLLGIVGAAHALLNWHSRHGYCANCGAASTVTLGGWRRDCPACNAQHFPRVDPVVIMLTIDGDRCLLGRQPQFAPGMYSALAGFLEPGETIEHAVRREVEEESGISCSDVLYFSSQPWPFPSSLMIGCFARATSTTLVVDRTELEDARWFTRQEIADMLAGTHPQGLCAPKPYAIAHHLMREFAARGVGVLA